MTVISAGAVFFGTRIRNGPNFMVKSIADPGWAERCLDWYNRTM